MIQRFLLRLPASLVTGVDYIDDIPDMSEAEIKDLLDRTRPAASDGKYEVFKTTDRFDATAHNPAWLG